MQKRKSKMKRIAIVILFAALMGGCLKEDQCLDTGIITGMDPRDCMCCGGWFITVQETARRFDQLPADCTIDFSKVSYPLKVRVEWKKKDTLCLGDEIILTRLLPEE